MLNTINDSQISSYSRLSPFHIVRILECYGGCSTPFVCRRWNRKSYDL